MDAAPETRDGSHRRPRVAIIGGGPAGLIAAETLASSGVELTVFEAMPSVGRKFLLAGRGGLNLTHGEDLDTFLERYGRHRSPLEPAVRQFSPDALRSWAHGLGIETFVGSSGRVFPRQMKAAPLLRSWLTRLRTNGVRFAVRHRWRGWSQQSAASDRSGAQHLRFDTPAGEREVVVDAVLLALGGGSWPRFGSDGSWLSILSPLGIDCAPLRPANCGFDIARGGTPGWSDHFLQRFRGQPVKSVHARVVGPDGELRQAAGECLISASGIEGGLVYALSSDLRTLIERDGRAVLELDLSPQRSLERLTDELARPRGSRSLATHLRTQAGIAGIKAGLLREYLAPADLHQPPRLAAAIKGLPLELIAPRPLAEAISSAGGIRFSALDQHFMLRCRPGVFAAGEMLDWEAPTGGYLLTACFATGHAAACGVDAWLSRTAGHPVGEHRPA